MILKAVILKNSKNLKTSFNFLRTSENVQILDSQHIQKNIGSSFSLWGEEVTPQENEGF